jgi:tetratricopeptide (TPR) repeat protein
MNYPGNPSLSAAVQERVVSTFRQTLALFQQGSRMDEVAAGCTLLLQMDPMFDPAKKLMEKMRNPASPIDVGSLMADPARDARSPMAQARTAMADRDFQRVLHLTSEILTDDLLNDEARILGDDAREKLEAAPFVEQFARKASLSLSSGNVAAAKMELEKARALDPTHPEVVRVGKDITARDAAPISAGLPPSFIVDDAKSAPQSGRPAAQAADFGFTFEEEKATDVSFDQFSFDRPAPAADVSFQAPPPPPKDDSPFGGFSFDATPSAPAPASASSPMTGGDFDFSGAMVQTSDDDQKKIEQFTADGDRAFQAGDYSQAIDLWSRIFLIDVTNDAASERIETAKAKRREIEQQVEPLLTAGVDAFERGDTAKARTSLAAVLAIDPRNSVAHDFLHRLGAPTDEVQFTPSHPYVAPSSAPLDRDLFDEELPPGLEMPLIPPDPPAMGSAAPSKRKEQAKVAKKGPSRPLPVKLIAIVVGVLALAGGGWFVWTHFSSAPEAEESIAGQGDALIGRATVLAGNGKFDQAIALLQDIKPGDPQHEKALLMIADLRGKKSTSAQLIDGVPAEEYYAQRIDAARRAFAASDFTGAKAAFEEAMRVKPLPADLKTQYEASAQQASKLDTAKALFSERKYAEAISNLEPLRAQEPQNASIQRMIADAHFNLAAMALQEERVPDAIREFDEVLRMNPDDEMARRSRELAVRYNGETKDLLYKIYVKYLPLRQGT